MLFCRGRPAAADLAMTTQARRTRFQRRLSRRDCPENVTKKLETEKGKSELFDLWCSLGESLECA